VWPALAASVLAASMTLICAERIELGSRHVLHDGWPAHHGIKGSVWFASASRPAEFGLATTSDLPAGHEAASVPLELLITPTVARYHPEVGRTLRLLNTSDVTSLALYVLYELQLGDSTWGPWLKALKGTLGGLVAWQEDELAELQGSPVLDSLASRKRSARESYDEVMTALQSLDLAHIFPREQYSWDRFLWACAFIWERATVLQLPMSGEAAPELALVPFFDFAQHHQPGARLEVRDGAVRAILEGPAGLDAGSPFYINWGNFSNHQLMLHRGVALASNPFNVVPVRGHPDDDGIFGNQKQKILEEAGISRDHVYSLAEHLVDGELLFALRVDAMKMKELGKAELAHKGQPISPINELEALRTLAALCVEMEKHYATTLEDDEKLLQQKPQALPPRRHAALLMRRSEKLILRQCVQAARMLWRSLLLDDPSEKAFN